MSYHSLSDKSMSPASFDGPSDDFLPQPYSNQRLRRVSRLSTVNVGLLVLQLILLTVHLSKEWIPSTPKYVASTYGFDTKYMTLDHDFDWLWEDRAVQRAGAIAVKTDKANNVTEYGVISMFHQLHCVSSLRKALQRAYEGEPVAFDQNQDPHWPHCLHYLHQMIVCKADDQIEKQQTWNFTLPFISGAEDVRQCGNSQKLFDLFEKDGA